jgi:hypothetical protein
VEVLPEAGQYLTPQQESALLMAQLGLSGELEAEAE